MKLIVLFIIFCIIVWYFKIDVRGYVDSHPQIKIAFTDITNYVKAIWDNYVASAASFIWDNILVNIVWKGGVEPLLHMRG